MKYDPETHHRRSIRMPEYDYSDPGAYFITVCASRRVCSFGEIVNCQVNPSAVGRIVHRCWVEIPSHSENVELDEFIVMPNHLHGILKIVAQMGTACRAPTGFQTCVHDCHAPNHGAEKSLCPSSSMKYSRGPASGVAPRTVRIWPLGSLKTRLTPPLASTPSNARTLP